MAYLPLSTANLPDPVIDPAQGASSEDHFNTVLYSGTGSTQTISGVGFQPDFIWVKSRNNAGHNILLNVLSGNSLQLKSNTTDAETAYFNQEFESDGFSTTASDTSINGSGYTYASWNWKANGSGVSNTDGSITSTVSANTTSGFSICTFSSTGSDATVGHGLSSTPDWAVFMRRNTAGSDHLVYHSALGATKNMRLNNTDAVRTQDHFLNTEPTSSVFSLKGTVFAADRDYVAYFFSGVEGFSKFGSYVGNGSADGPFVYTGFRPAFVMFKNTTTAGTLWIMFDAERDTYNVVDTYLQAQASSAEASFPFLDLVSNGFKHRHTSSHTNTSGNTYIYMAFAENPFKYSNAR